MTILPLYFITDDLNLLIKAFSEREDRPRHRKADNWPTQIQHFLNLWIYCTYPSGKVPIERRGKTWRDHIQTDQIDEHDFRVEM